MKQQLYCVMGSFTVTDEDNDKYDALQSCTVFVEANSEEEARQEGKRRIAAKVPSGSVWNGEVTVYEKKNFDLLRQWGLLPKKKGDSHGS